LFVCFCVSADKKHCKVEEVEEEQVEEEKEKIWMVI
jgi:hypothetical protein